MNIVLAVARQLRGGVWISERRSLFTDRKLGELACWSAVHRIGYGE